MIKNLNIIITGTTSGIGNELTKRFLDGGNNVWGCARSENNINKSNYFHTKIDLSDNKQIEDWLKKIEEETKRKIDIFIVNAVKYERKLNSLDSLDSISKTINVNLTASIVLTKTISKFMIQKKGGLIVFFSSVASILNEIGTSAYASSKAGLETFSKIIKKELETFNIKVATLRILYIPTNLSKKLNDKEVKSLKEKFKTNKYNNVDKIFQEINNLHNIKEIQKTNLYYDDLKN